MSESYKFCNQLICGCGIAGMKQLPADSVPLIVTSPPFDDMRLFGGHSFHFEPMARELFRVTAEGGVVCWHVQEQIKNGSETGTSSEQRLYFRDLGFRLHHTLVVESLYYRSQVRYGASLQYVFVLSKGKPRTFNQIRDVPNKLCGKTKTGFTRRREDGSFRTVSKIPIGAMRARGPVWNPARSSSSNSEKLQHPALMNENLARDLIRSWSRPGDLVLDPMSGAGTTAKAALLEGRQYLGFEIFREYHDVAVVRLENTLKQMQQGVGVA